MERRNLSPEMSLRDWMAYWLRTTEDFRRITTAAKYGETLASAVCPALGDLPLKEITEERIAAFLEGEKEKGQSVSRMGTMLTVLTAGLTSAVNHHLIRRNPCRMLRLPIGVKRECAILTDEEICRLVREQGDAPYTPMILTMLFLGLRVGEAIGLEWKHVDWERRTVRICQQSVSYYAEGRTVSRIVPYTKNGVIRTLPLCDPVLECLRTLYGAGKEPGAPVFVNGAGERVVYAAFYYAFNKQMAALGREDVHPHTLRHTAASTLLYRTGDLLLVKEYLGHRSIRSSERYPEATEAEKREAAEALDRFFQPYGRMIFGWGCQGAERKVPRRGRAAG